MEQLPKLVAFDVDGTLIEAGQALSPEFHALFDELLTYLPIAIITGRSLHEIERVLGDRTRASHYHDNFFALPQCGSALHSWHGEWREHYVHTLLEEEQRRIQDVLHTHVFGTHFISPHGEYDRHILNKGTAITFVAFSADTPVEEKKAWDPTREKRQRIKSVIEPLLPEYDVSIGGLGALDITQKGMDKGYGVRELAKHCTIAEQDILYFGDMLFPGGNDYPVTQTGARAIEVAGPHETYVHVEELLKRLEHGE